MTTFLDKKFLVAREKKSANKQVISAPSTVSRLGEILPHWANFTKSLAISRGFIFCQNVQFL